jgi:hypothetical protein
MKRQHAETLISISELKDLKAKAQRVDHLLQYIERRCQGCNGRCAHRYQCAHEKQNYCDSCFLKAEKTLTERKLDKLVSLSCLQ